MKKYIKSSRDKNQLNELVKYATELLSDMIDSSNTDLTIEDFEIRVQTLFYDEIILRAPFDSTYEIETNLLSKLDIAANSDLSDSDVVRINLQQFWDIYFSDTGLLGSSDKSVEDYEEQVREVAEQLSGTFPENIEWWRSDDEIAVIASPNRNAKGIDIQLELGWWSDEYEILRFTEYVSFVISSTEDDIYELLELEVNKTIPRIQSAQEQEQQKSRFKPPRSWKEFKQAYLSEYYGEVDVIKDSDLGRYLLDKYILPIEDAYGISETTEDRISYTWTTSDGRSGDRSQEEYEQDVAEIIENSTTPAKFKANYIKYLDSILN